MSEENFSPTVEKPAENKVAKSNQVAKFFALGIAGILLVAVLVFFGIVKNQVQKLSENPTILFGAKVFNIPAAKINGLGVSYVDYIEDLKTLRTFYTNNSYGIPRPSDEQISDQVIARLVTTRLVENLAKQYGVKVTTEDLVDFKNELLAQFIDEKTAEAEMQKAYGWSLDKYMQKVGLPILTEQKLQEVFGSSTEESAKQFQTEEYRARHILFPVDEANTEAEAKAQANSILARLNGGEDFAVLAQEFGTDSTKEQGGDLGWFDLNMMVPEFSLAVAGLEPGQLSSEPVQTQYGFHLIKLEEKRMKNDFIAFMDNEFKNASIFVLIPINDPFAPLQESLTDLETDTTVIE